MRLSILLIALVLMALPCTAHSQSVYQRQMNNAVYKNDVAAAAKALKNGAHVTDVEFDELVRLAPKTIQFLLDNGYPVEEMGESGDLYYSLFSLGPHKTIGAKLRYFMSQKISPYTTKKKTKPPCSG